MLNTFVPDATKFVITQPYFYYSGGSVSQTAPKLSWPKNQPDMYLLTEINTPNYKLQDGAGIILLVNVDGTDILVSEPRLNLFGVGQNIKEAVNEYTSMLVDLFEELTESENILSYKLHQQLDYLRSIVTPC